MLLWVLGVSTLSHLAFETLWQSICVWQIRLCVISVCYQCVVLCLHLLWSVLCADAWYGEPDCHCKQASYRGWGQSMYSCCNLYWVQILSEQFYIAQFAFVALMLLAECQEEHLTCRTVWKIVIRMVYFCEFKVNKIANSGNADAYVIWLPASYGIYLKRCNYQFPVSQGSAEALVGWGGKINILVVTYFLSNSVAKIIKIW